MVFKDRVTYFSYGPWSPYSPILQIWQISSYVLGRTVAILVTSLTTLDQLNNDLLIHKIIWQILSVICSKQKSSNFYISGWFNKVILSQVLFYVFCKLKVLALKWLEIWISSNFVYLSRLAQVLDKASLSSTMKLETGPWFNYISF